MRKEIIYKNKSIMVYNLLERNFSKCKFIGWFKFDNSFVDIYSSPKDKVLFFATDCLGEINNCITKISYSKKEWAKLIFQDMLNKNGSKIKASNKNIEELYIFCTTM